MVCVFLDKKQVFKIKFLPTLTFFDIYFWLKQISKEKIQSGMEKNKDFTLEYMAEYIVPSNVIKN